MISAPSAIERDRLVSKVPQVTLAFWVIKVLATTVGETGGDALSMTLNLGYAVSSLILLGFFAITLAAQVSSRKYHPFAYWAVVVATTTIGTTTSDYIDRTLGLGYILSSLGLFCVVLSILFLWRRTVGRIEFENITTKREEIFYWVTILASNTLGTALGDYVATDTGLGFERGALVFAGLIALVAVAYATLRENSSQRLVLVGLHPDAAPGGHARRHPHEAPRGRRPRAGADHVLAHHGGAHGRWGGVGVPARPAPQGRILLEGSAWGRSRPPSSAGSRCGTLGHQPKHDQTEPPLETPRPDPVLCLHGPPCAGALRSGWKDRHGVLPALKLRLATRLPSGPLRIPGLVDLLHQRGASSRPLPGRDGLGSLGKPPDVRRPDRPVGRRRRLLLL